MASRAFRVRLGLAAGCMLLLGLSGCATPQFTYVSDSSANAYFKVPYVWHKISPSAMAAELSSVTGSSGTAWNQAFDGDTTPSATHFLSGSTSEPFLFAEIGQLNQTATNSLSYDTLRDFLLPVTSSARQTAAQSNFPLTGFRLLRDNTLTPGQGVHGVRETFQYTYPGGLTDTFDEVVLTNAVQNEVYFLIVHCMNTCYSQQQSAINTVMSSFTVRSP